MSSSQTVSSFGGTDNRASLLYISYYCTVVISEMLTVCPTTPDLDCTGTHNLLAENGKK